MPVDAIVPGLNTQPSMPRRVMYRRHYRDAALRTLDGHVIITPADRSATEHVVVVPAPLVIELVKGELAVELVPGSYELRAELRSLGGALTIDTDTVNVQLPDGQE